MVLPRGKTIVGPKAIIIVKCLVRVFLNDFFEFVNGYRLIVNGNVLTDVVHNLVVTKLIVKSHEILTIFV